jgi:hypothetical protein
MPRMLIPALAALAALLVGPAAAQAKKIDVAVGMGDQSHLLFQDPEFKKLKLKKVRYFIRWNAIDDPVQLGIADAYVAAAKRARVRVVMPPSSDNLTRAADARRQGVRAAKLPTVREYRQKVGALVRRYGGRELDWGVFNEANHDTQPTYRNPRRAAQYFLEMRKMCKGCTIVALDVLDQPGVARYINRFYAALGKRKSQARIVGIHNYSDTNRFRQKGRRKGSGTKTIIDATKRHNRRAQFWLTETGGLVKFGRSFPCTPSTMSRAERRQANAVTDMFRLVRMFRRDIKRLYSYNWNGTDCGPGARFDAGLVRVDGKPRPALRVFRTQLRNFKR